MADAVVNGVRLFYQRLGIAGAPLRVVFIHGLVMDNLSSWFFTVANEVALDADVLLYDLRGHGRSEQPASGYGIEAFLLDLAELIETVLGPGPVVLVGNSFGAQLAVRFAVRYPERVAGLALVDGHPGDARWGPELADQLSLRGAEADRQVEERFADWLGRHSHRKRARLANQASALIEGSSLVADLRSAPGLVADDYARVTAPVLALYGDASEMFAAAVPFIERMPGARLEIFTGRTHSLLWEETDEVRRRIVAFCRSLRARAVP
jgi:pimeloyl-ACP methyl ester carboxylesterase